MKTALVFPGAGAKIVVELGFAKAWRDSGRKYDCILGTSAGSIVSACLHGNQLDDLERLLLTIKNKNVYHWDLLNAFNSKASILSNAPLRKVLTKLLNPAKIRANTSATCKVIATDLATWNAKSFDLTKLTDEEIINALMASTAVPVAFPCVDYLVDGGVVDDYPVYDALAEEVDRIVVFNTSNLQPRPINNILDMIGQIIGLSFYGQFISTFKGLEVLKPKAEIVLIQVQEATGIPLLDFDALGKPEQRQKLIDNAYTLASTAISKLSW